MMRNLITLMVLLGVVAVGLSLTFIRAVPLPRTIEVVPPVTSKLVCAPMGEPGVLFVDGAEAITELGQDSEQAAGTTLVSGQVGPAVIRGGHALMGGIHVTGTDTRAFVSCTTPRSKGLILVPGTASTDLVVVNPDASEAVVDLTLYGTDGEIVALGARGIAVGPHSSRTVALSVLAEVEGPVGVEYRASRGRATVVARTDSVEVLAASSSSVAGTKHWLAGIPQGATTATVLVTNPGNERAAVEVTALGASTAYQPEGGAGISVPAHSTVAVELAASLAGEGSGLDVSSDVDIAVALSTGTGGDIALSSPVQVADELGAYAPAGGTLQLSNPGDAVVSADVAIDVIDGEKTTSTITLQAGSTSTVVLPGDAPRGLTVAVTAQEPVFGAITLLDAGAAIVPLTTTQAPVVDPVDAEIMPTLR